MDKAEEYLNNQGYTRTIFQRETVIELLQQYANEVSREVAIKFADYAMREVENSTWKTTNELYNEWKSNQEEQ